MRASHWVTVETGLVPKPWLPVLSVVGAWRYKGLARKRVEYKHNFTGRDPVLENQKSGKMPDPPPYFSVVFYRLATSVLFML